jgi:Ca2+-binding EF-hand superfamily protein
MRVTGTVIVAAGLALAGTLVRADEQSKAYDPRAAFAESDTNRDGVVDHEEFHARIVEVFYSADANKDGFLDATELKQLAFPEDFTANDKDRDGRVAMREFLRIRFDDYDVADKNGDGVLSIDEVVAVYEVKTSR